MAALLLLAARAAFAAWHVDRPGLQYDELLFVNAADERVGGTFIHRRVWGLPVLVMPYIGALKSWIWAPVFEVFGVGPRSIRIPAIVITSAAIAAVADAVRRVVSLPTAAAVLVLLAADPVLFAMTRADVGPSVVELATKCGALWCLSRWWEQRTGRWLGAALLLAALGVFNKLNFIWTVNAVLAIALGWAFVHWRQVSADRQARWSGAGVAVLYGAFGAYYLAADIGSIGGGGSFQPQPWRSFAATLQATFDGTWFDLLVLGDAATRPAAFAGLVALVAVGCVGAAYGSGRSAVVGAAAVCALLVWVQIYVTSEATAGWHHLAVQPFAAIVAGHGVAVVASWAGRWRPAAGAVVLGGVLAVIGLAGASAIVRSQHRIESEPTNLGWTEVSYALSDHLRGGEETVLLTDWGVTTVLLAFEPSDRYLDAWPAFNTTPEAAQAYLDVQLAAPGAELLVVRGEGNEIMAGTRANALLAMGDRAVLEQRLVDRFGRVIFEIYRSVG